MIRRRSRDEQPDMGSVVAIGRSAPDRVDGLDEDAELAAAVRGGDAGALHVLYERHGARCYGLARRILVDPNLAQDAVQEAFLALWRQTGFDSSRGSVATWLLTITHHKSVDLVRREERRRARSGDVEELNGRPSADPGPDEEASRLLEAERVRGAVSALPAEQREVLLLAYYGGYTQAEIASMTGQPLGTVKSRTVAAMRKLQDALGDVRPQAGPRATER